MSGVGIFRDALISFIARVTFYYFITLIFFNFSRNLIAAIAWCILFSVSFGYNPVMGTSTSAIWSSSVFTILVVIAAIYAASRERFILAALLAGSSVYVHGIYGLTAAIFLMAGLAGATLWTSFAVLRRAWVAIIVYIAVIGPVVISSRVELESQGTSQSLDALSVTNWANQYFPMAEWMSSTAVIPVLIPSLGVMLMVCAVAPALTKSRLFWAVIGMFALCGAILAIDCLHYSRMFFGALTEAWFIIQMRRGVWVFGLFLWILLILAARSRFSYHKTFAPIPIFLTLLTITSMVWMSALTSTIVIALSVFLLFNNSKRRLVFSLSLAGLVCAFLILAMSVFAPNLITGMEINFKKTGSMVAIALAGTFGLWVARRSSRISHGGACSVLICLAFAVLIPKSWTLIAVPALNQRTIVEDLAAYKAEVDTPIFDRLLNSHVEKLRRFGGSHPISCLDINAFTSAMTSLRGRPTGRVMIYPQCSSTVMSSHMLGQPIILRPYFEMGLGNFSRSFVADLNFRLQRYFGPGKDAAWFYSDPAYWPRFQKTISELDESGLCRLAQSKVRYLITVRENHPATKLSSHGPYSVYDLRDWSEKTCPK